MRDGPKNRRHLNLGVPSAGFTFDVFSIMKVYWNVTIEPAESLSHPPQVPSFPLAYLKPNLLFYLRSQDAAPAVGNAAGAVWPNAYGTSTSGPRSDMCAYHMGPKWLDAHKDVLPANEAELEGIFDDLRQYQKCPVLSLVKSSLLFDAMLRKWETAGYIELAEKFNFWRAHRTTYIETNQLGGAVIGGAMNTNNHTESHNNVIKLEAKRAILRLIPFLTFLMGKFGRNTSCDDTFFGSTMNSDVHSVAFYKSVREILGHESGISICTVRFELAAVGGKVHIPSGPTLSKAIIDAGKNPTSRSVKALLKDPHGRYVNFTASPGRFVPEQIDFDGALAISHSFYSMTPITDENYVRRLYTRLHYDAGMTLMPIELALALGNKGVMACGCPVFLQRSWCKHSCADAMYKRIIISLSPTMQKQSTPLVQADATRARKSRKGGALGFV